MRGRRRYDLRVIEPLERTAGKRLGDKLPTHQVGPRSSVAAPVEVRLGSLEGVRSTAALSALRLPRREPVEGLRERRSTSNAARTVEGPWPLI